MAAPLIQALQQAAFYGFTAIQTLNFLGNKFQKLKSPIKQAQQIGHKAEDILEFLSGKQNFKGDNEFRRTQRGLGYTEKGERLKKGIKTAAMALPLAAVGYGAIRAAFARNQAIRPSAILPPLPQQQAQRALPGPQAQRGLPAPGPRAPTQPQPPQPQGPAPATPGLTQQLPTQTATPSAPEPTQSSEMPEVPELKAIQQKEADIGQLWDLAKKGKTQGNPFLKMANQLIKKGDIKDVKTFTNFRNWWQATEGKPRSNPLVEFEKFRVETKGMFEPTEKPAETFKKGDQIQLPSGKKATIKDISEKVARVAREDGKEAQYRVTDLKKLSEATPKAKEYAKALYQQPGEPKEEWENRKLIAHAAKKAAKEIVQGKTFLDFPIPPEAIAHGGLSVAEDVLNFMAGNSNAYEYLDEDDREEIEAARDLYGAQITPNMVWNMLLVQEPKLKQPEMRPKSVKGRETIKGGKMGSSEFRRSLTHMVYGMISGKGLSTELADKITKLSGARALLDTFDEAFKQGKRAKIDEEMEKLMDDEYFNSLFTDEVEEQLKRIR